MEWVILLIIWLLSPIVLTVIAVGQHSKADNFQKLYSDSVKENIRLKDRIKQLEEQLAGGQPTEQTAPAEEKQTDPLTAEKQTDPPAEENTSQPQTTAEEAPVKEEKSQPYDMSYLSGSYTAPKQPEPKPEKTAEKTEAAPKARVSSINVLFIIGALFIITAGLIFATTTWEFLSSGIRAVIILSLSAAFFGASSLAERKFSLEKTGMLFYTLGSVFLPITLIAAGYFEVFGEWFSLSGEGRPLLFAVTCGAMSVVTLKGGCDYKSKTFSWCGLVSLSLSVCCLILQFTGNTEMFALAASVYSFALLFICSALSKNTSEKLAPVISQLNTFAALNTILLSVSSLASAFSEKNSAITFASCAIFAAGYLKSSFTQKNGFAGAVPFTIFAACGMFAISSADDFGGYMTTLVFASAIPAVLSFMNFFPEKLKSAATVVSSIFAAITATLCAFASFAADPSLIMLLAYILLGAEVLALHLLHKNEKSGQAMLSVFPVPCLMTAIVGARLIFADMAGNTFAYTVVTAIILMAVIQAVFVFAKPLKLRTTASDYIISISLFMAGIAAAAASAEKLYVEALSETTSIAGILIASAAILFPIKDSLEPKRQPFTAGALLCSAFLTFPIFSLLDSNPDIVSAMTVTGIIMASAYALISVLTTLLCRQHPTEATVTIITRIIIGLLIFAVIVASESRSPLFLILTAAVIFRGAKRQDSIEFGAGLVLLFTTALTGAIDFLGADVGESLLWASGVAAVTYLAALFVPEGKLVKTADTVSRYGLLSLNCLCMFCILDRYTQSVLFTVMTVLFMILTITAFYNSKKTSPLFATMLLFYLAITPMTQFILDLNGLDDTVRMESGYFSITADVIAAIMLLTLIPSFVLHRNRLVEKDGKIRNYDIFAFSRFIGLLAFSTESCGSVQQWFTAVLLAVCILSLRRKEQNPVLQQIIYSAAAFTPVIAWITQPFFTVPDIIALEFNIVPILIYCFVMRFMWKNALPIVDNLTFIVYILSFVALFIDAMDSGYVADGLIIVISALVMLIFSFMVKKKKWFILSVTVIVVSTVFMSRAFWASLAWWVYLLAAGLLLIVIAAANELKKQAAAKNEKSEFEQKLTRFMSEWTW